MARTLDEVIAALPARRRQRVESRAIALATLRELREAAQQTQRQLAETLGVGQDSLSRLEQRRDMRLSTLRRYVESVGGTLTLVAQFPDRPPVVIDTAGTPTRPRGMGDRSTRRGRPAP